MFLFSSGLDFFFCCFQLIDESFFFSAIINLIFFLAFWYREEDAEEYFLCGNATGSTACPEGYVCWKDRGEK